MRLFPVNSSAPPTTTRIRPSENARPPRMRAGPNGSGSPVDVVAMVERTAPNAMNAPASTPRTNVRTKGIAAFAAPTSSAFASMAGGSRASSDGGGGDSGPLT
jgi:hypothetical protein